MHIFSRVKKVKIFYCPSCCAFCDFQLCTHTVRSPNYNGFQSQQKFKIPEILIFLRDILFLKIGTSLLLPVKGRQSYLRYQLLQKTQASLFGGGALFNFRKILLKGGFCLCHNPACLSESSYWLCFPFTWVSIHCDFPLFPLNTVCFSSYFTFWIIVKIHLKEVQWPGKFTKQISSGLFMWIIARFLGFLVFVFRSLVLLWTWRGALVLASFVTLCALFPALPLIQFDKVCALIDSDSYPGWVQLPDSCFLRLSPCHDKICKSQSTLQYLGYLAHKLIPNSLELLLQIVL